MFITTNKMASLLQILQHTDLLVKTVSIFINKIKQVAIVFFISLYFLFIMYVGKVGYNQMTMYSKDSEIHYCAHDSQIHYYTHNSQIH